jgi:predicted lipoprotein with Yx(FWY)xxD motif
MRVAAVLAVAWLSLHTAVGAAGAAEGTPHEVVLVPTGAGWKFTDRAGMSLYFYDRDINPGKSECGKGCYERWPPLLAPPQAKPSGHWSLVARPEGTVQWAFDGRPLYRYAHDAYPGAQFGDRPENDAWHIAGLSIPLPPVATVAAFMGGKVLTSSSGATLYVLDTDRWAGAPAGPMRPVSYRRDADDASPTDSKLRALHSGCSGDCLLEWHPLEAGLLSLPIGEWSIALREDGTRQWMFRGRPLYTFAEDAPRESHGEGREGVWHRAMLEPPPPMPDWVRLQPTDGGIVAADPRGMTLYAYEAEMNVNRPSGGASERGCNQYCLDLYRPVLAAPDARTVGDWSIVPAANGARQWAYKGLPLSTFAEDRQPGDIVGTKPYRVWHTILPAGIPMQGAGGG